MARTREFDTDQAIADMAGLFWRNGYEGTGIAEIVEATGVGRASLYAAFGSKRDMLERSLDWYLSQTIEEMVKPLESGLDAIEQRFRTFAEAVRAKPDMARMGCMMVNVGSEVGGIDSELGMKAGAYRERFRDAYRRGLQNAVEQGVIDGDIEAKANQLTLMTMGMFVAIRSGADVEEVEALGESAASEVSSWRLD